MEETISVEVTLNEPVTVTGRPELTLDTGEQTAETKPQTQKDKTGRRETIKERSKPERSGEKRSRQNAGV